MPRQPGAIFDADLALLIAPGIGPATRRKLIEHFGAASRVMDASVRDLASLPGVGRLTAEAIRRALDEAQPDRERRAMLDAGAAVIMEEDEDYPVLLQAVPDRPAALWIRGEMTADDRYAIALVGSRRCTAYGREQAGRFASLLAQSGLTIVSGGALGVDGESHRGALRVGGRTLVVMGCGLARIYPREHRELFDRVVEGRGALLSEHPMDAEPMAHHFPQRNRIISGLSLGVLVIEAAKRSGALITARLAAEEHGREVMALPGRVDSPASSGCLALIRDGGAALVCDHADVLQQLDGAGHLLRGTTALRDGSDLAQSTDSLFERNLTDSQRAIIDVLAAAETQVLVDQIAARTQIPMNQLMAELTLLQIRGQVQRDHRGVRLKRPAYRDG